MDRLFHLIIVAGLMTACGKGETPKPTPEQQPAAIKVPEQNDEAAAKDFCDKSWPGVGATSMPFSGGPARRKLEGTKEPASGTWRWVNYWATWCGPCIDEIPLLERWHQALVKEGTPIALELWSVDEDEARLKKKLAEGMPGDKQWVASPQTLADYLGKLGLDPEATLPIHMLVDPNDKLRCVRVGSVSGDHYPTVRKLLGLQ